jgi:hypothetical protein
MESGAQDAKGTEACNGDAASLADFGASAGHSSERPPAALKTEPAVGWLPLISSAPSSAIDHDV